MQDLVSQASGGVVETLFSKQLPVRFLGLREVWKAVNEP